MVSEESRSRRRSSSREISGMSDKIAAVLLSEATRSFLHPLRREKSPHKTARVIRPAAFRSYGSSRPGYCFLYRRSGGAVWRKDWRVTAPAVEPHEHHHAQRNNHGETSGHHHVSFKPLFQVIGNNVATAFMWRLCGSQKKTLFILYGFHWGNLSCLKGVKEPLTNACTNFSRRSDLEMRSTLPFSSA